MKNKKAKAKALLAAHNRAFKARRSLQLKFFLCIMLLFASVATVGALTSPEDSRVSIEVIAGTSFASMMAIGNIDDVGDLYVSGEAIAYKVWLVETSQLDPTKDFPAPNEDREVDTIPLKSDQVMHYFEAHDIPTYGSTGEKGDLTISPTNSFDMIMGGVGDKLLDFIEQKTGGKFIIIFQECESPNKYIMGNPCKPMVLRSYTLKNDKENRSVTLHFENNTIRQYKKYTGEIISIQTP